MLLKKMMISENFKTNKSPDDIKQMINEDFVLFNKIELKKGIDFSIYQSKFGSGGVFIKISGKNINEDCFISGSNLDECFNRSQVVNYLEKYNLYQLIKDKLQAPHLKIDIKMNEEKLKYIKLLSNPILEAIDLIIEQQNDNGIPAFHTVEIQNKYGGFDDKYLVEDYVYPITEKFGLKSSELNLIPIQYSKEIANYIFNKIKTDDEKIKIVKELSFHKLLNQDISKILTKNIVIENKHILTQQQVREDVSKSKISLTMFRYDKNFNDNLIQNNKLENVFIKMSKDGVFKDIKIEKTKGIWYENGDSSEEPGFTLVGNKENIEEAFKSILDILQNMKKYDLNPEHSQSGVYLKLDDKSYIYEKNELNSYNAQYELQENLNIELDNYVLNNLKKCEKLKYIGGTINTEQQIISLSLIPEHFEVIKTILNDSNIDFYDNSNIKIEQENKEIKKQHLELLGDIPF